MSQDQITLILSSLRAIRQDIGELKGDVRVINARLDKLNGSAARHEQALSETKVALAAHTSADEGKENSNQTWADRLMPGMWMVAGTLVSLALLHGASVLNGPDKRGRST